MLRKKIHRNLKVSVIGLGYVGMPLLIEFSKHFSCVGFDNSQHKIDSYLSGSDPNHEISKSDLEAFINGDSLLTSQESDLRDIYVFVVAVPTPVDSARLPDFRYLVDASRTVGRVMKAGSVVVYESTVYPGATEEVCVPHLEDASGMRWRVDFNVGYSPERINPGDREHSLTKIVKVVSADDPDTLDFLAALYSQVIHAGVHCVSNIRVAEAAKVIENTQRDINIALMNEVAIIFERLDISTKEVLEAANTKWNFLNFRPGLVGGHCVGVDPYYLTHKAEMIGYHPEVILSGRRINDGMGKFIAEKTLKMMVAQDIEIRHAQVTVLGVAFKENCSDVRNSRVFDVIKELIAFGCRVYAHDPLVDRAEVRREYEIDVCEWEELPSNSAALILAAPHDFYTGKSQHELYEKVMPSGCIVDVKGVLDPVDGYNYWSV